MLRLARTGVISKRRESVAREIVVPLRVLRDPEGLEANKTERERSIAPPPPFGIHTLELSNA